MTILVAGGAGYIGSHTVRELAREGFDVLVLDNLSSGRRELVAGVPCVEADLLDREALGRIFRDRPIGAVLHFASLIQVGESFANPRKYYTHNLTTSLNLFDAMLEAGTKALIFSSTAAVYGEPETTPIPEDHPTRPANPYGRAKLMVEDILRDYERAHGLRSISLRYFNAAGAALDGTAGECHSPETHLVPNVLLSLLGKAPRLKVFGGDFPTPDGTAVRDYIHVTDLAAAHVLALKRLLAGEAGDVINLGTEAGRSVLEVIRTAEKVTGRPVPYDLAPRRQGDVAVLLASKARAARILGWAPRLSSLETIVESAWNWHRKAV
ncbi:MAG TPA: UDP-glucose 4-epimerase GalE [Candidatus Aminicenantes bacterium]|nr:UDP-glucose 4-epimerase GalE [Candidatus Aminicenantes bacterium]HRY65470.1 UDP-glucose 4-epimerase GalE [Candidatus Aminicenantes bacterium]HRZ72062.1 UDP-glucose 4-epimerase GalE [Candidatus Aminicenantes bacterium]